MGGLQQVGMSVHALDVQRTLFHSFAFAAEYGDDVLLSHLQRVSTYTRQLAELLYSDPLEVVRLEIAAFVHDVGKRAIPRELLFKPGPLLPEERKFMEVHTEAGRAMIEELETYVQLVHGTMIFDKRTFQYAKEIALYHHENFDGSGYPHKLRGIKIPLEARIVRVADVADALLSARPYKPPWIFEQVEEELYLQSGIQFDPNIVDAFLLLFKDVCRKKGGAG